MAPLPFFHFPPLSPILGGPNCPPPKHTKSHKSALSIFDEFTQFFIFSICGIGFPMLNVRAKDMWDIVNPMPIADRRGLFNHRKSDAN
jgi:hypothetical protein